MFNCRLINSTSDSWHLLKSVVFTFTSCCRCLSWFFNSISDKSHLWKSNKRVLTLKIHDSIQNNWTLQAFHVASGLKNIQFSRVWIFGNHFGVMILKILSLFLQRSCLVGFDSLSVEAVGHLTYLSISGV